MGRLPVKNLRPLGWGRGRPVALTVLGNQTPGGQEEESHGYKQLCWEADGLSQGGRMVKVVGGL